MVEDLLGIVKWMILSPAIVNWCLDANIQSFKNIGELISVPKLAIIKENIFRTLMLKFMYSLMHKATAYSLFNIYYKTNENICMHLEIDLLKFSEYLLPCMVMNKY